MNEKLLKKKFRYGDLDEVTKYLDEVIKGARKVWIILRYKILYAPSADWITEEEFQSFGDPESWRWVPMKERKFIWDDNELRWDVIQYNAINLASREDEFFHGFLDKIKEIPQFMVRDIFVSLKDKNKLYWLLMEFPSLLLYKRILLNLTRDQERLHDNMQKPDRFFFYVFNLLGDKLPLVIEEVKKLNGEEEGVYIHKKGIMRHLGRTKGDVINLYERFKKSRILANKLNVQVIKQLPLPLDPQVQTARNFLPSLSNIELYSVTTPYAIGLLFLSVSNTCIFILLLLLFLFYYHKEGDLLEGFWWAPKFYYPPFYKKGAPW